LQGLAIVLLLACGALRASPAAARADLSLTIGLSQFPTELHPFAISSGAKNTVLGAVRRGLFAYDPHGDLVCRLCTELPSLANGRVRIEPDGSESVTITLLPGLTFADGTSLGARDLLRGLEEARVFQNIQTTATMIDDRTVRYRLPAPSSDLGRAIPDPYPAAIDTAPPADAIARLHGTTYSRAPTTPGLWNGPYLVAEIHPDASVILAPNPTWQGRKPAFRHVELRLIGNTAALEANLLSGDVDLPSAEVGLSFDQALQIARDHQDRFNTVFAPGEGVELLAVQLGNKLLADPRTRLAILAAIDRRTIAAKLFGNREPVATGFLPPQLSRAPGQVRVAGFVPGADGILRSPSGARFSIPIVTTAGNATRELMEQVMQTQLRQVGIELTIANVAARTLFGETLRQRNFSGLVLYQFGLAPGAVPFEQFHSHAIPTAANGYRGLNYPGLADPAMDSALEAATADLSQAGLTGAWTRIQGAYAADLPSLPLLDATKAFIVPKWLTGVAPPRETGMMTLWIEDWRPR
jgi:peptide/nickel transport system substrate-binding protein